MSETRPNVEIIPDVTTHFSETGLDTDVLNASWISNSMNSAMGKFDRLKPAPHYRKYFEEQDRVYEAVGKPGLLGAVMEHSNPKAVAAFDRLADEFNSALPQIIAEKDNVTVQLFLSRVNRLKDKLPDDPQKGPQT